MGISTRQHDDLDRLPPGAAQPGRMAPWSPRGWDWRVVAVLSITGLMFVIIGLPLIKWLFGDAIAAWLDSWWGFALGVMLLLWLMLWLTKGLLFERVPGGYRVATHRALRVDPTPVIERAQERDTVYAGAIVPAQITYSPTMQVQARGAKQTAPAALPDAGVQLVTDAEWRQWMDRAPHLLIAGRTDAGKTTLATALMTDRAMVGDELLILDPHYQPGKWSGLPAVGGGRDFESILALLPQLVRELNTRYETFERGKSTESFRRLTVLIDEVPALVASCMELTASGAPRITDMRWIKFAQKLGSEARKVRISVILMTQSTLVKDILINSQHRENFLRVGLGDRAGGLIGEARAERKGALYGLLSGQTHPAAMEWKGDYHLLDTSGVPALAQRAVQARGWTPPPMISVSSIPQTERVAPPPSVPTQPMTMTVKDQIVDILRARPRLTSTEIAGVIGVDVKVVRTEITELINAHTIIRHQRSGPGDKYAYSVPVNQSTVNAGA